MTLTVGTVSLTGGCSDRERTAGKNCCEYLVHAGWYEHCAYEHGQFSLLTCWI